MNQFYSYKTEAPKILSNLDSIKYQLRMMQYKVDSLQTITERTEIGKEFFSDAISSNLYNFAIIIGFLGLVSITSIFTILKKHQIRVNNNALRLIENHSEKYDKSLNEIKRSLLDTDANANRSMYFAALKNEAGSFHSFDWAMRTLRAMFYLDPDHPRIETWITAVSNKLKKIEVGEPKLKSEVNNYTDLIESIKIVSDPERQQQLNLIRDTILHLAYTIVEKAPDNLNQDEE